MAIKGMDGKSITVDIVVYNPGSKSKDFFQAEYAGPCSVGGQLCG